MLRERPAAGIRPRLLEWEQPALFASELRTAFKPLR
jgi:hypothetical protein